MTFKRIAVLMGGLSAEREVSLASGRAVAAGLRRAGFEVTEIDVARTLDQQLRSARPDAAFLALHGRLGEDGTVQGLLEVMGIPYTGSSVLSSALAMNKAFTKEILAANALPVPPGTVAIKGNAAPDAAELSFPVVVKPSDEGSSVGVSIVRTESDYSAALEEALGHSKQVLIERFVEGVEVNVAVVDNRPLGAVEIEPHREFYDYSAKYDAGGSTHHIPPRLPEATIEHCLELADRAYRALACSGAARVDLIVPRSAQPVILEVNTIPGMTETSLLPEIAEAAGISFDQLVSQIARSATLHNQPA